MCGVFSIFSRTASRRVAASLSAMIDHPHVNPDQGTFVVKVDPPAWPPTKTTVITPLTDLNGLVTHEIKALPDATLLLHTTSITGIDVTLQSCPITLHGSGCFKIAMRYSHDGATAFAGGKCIASNEPGSRPEEHVEITLRDYSKPDDPPIPSLEAPPTSAPKIGLFDAPRLKVARANRHISDLEVAQKAFFDRKPYIIVKETDAKSGKYRRVVRVREHLPDDFALIIGDAVHNLRAALDLLVCDLARANGQGTDGVMFPFCNDGAYLDTMIERRNLHTLAPDIQDMIRSLKPYKGGNERLRAMHDLDIADKHKLIIPVAGTVIEPTLILDFERGYMVRRSGADAIKPVKDGTILDRLLPEYVELDDSLTLFKIGFADGQPLARSVVVETLKELSELVDGIVEAFATHVLGQHRSDP